MTKLNPEDVSGKIREDGIIAIIRGTFSPPELLATAEALLDGGVGVLEVTLNTSHALAGIKQLTHNLANRVLIGAGTVRTQTDVDLALDAGAHFLISPNLDPASVVRAQARGCLHLPGVFTATEAQAAYAMGCSMVKLFPADALGPSYLKGLRAPLDHLNFVPTGGITPETLADFHAAGAVAFGVGSYLVRQGEVTPEALTRLIERALTLRQVLEKARSQPREIGAGSPVRLS